MNTIRTHFLIWNFQLELASIARVFAGKCDPISERKHNLIKLKTRFLRNPRWKKPRTERSGSIHGFDSDKLAVLLYVCENFNHIIKSYCVPLSLGPFAPSPLLLHFELYRSRSDFQTAWNLRGMGFHWKCGEWLFEMHFHFHCSVNWIAWQAMNIHTKQKRGKQNIAQSQRATSAISNLMSIAVLKA